MDPDPYKAWEFDPGPYKGQDSDPDLDIGQESDQDPYKDRESDQNPYKAKRLILIPIIIPRVGSGSLFRLRVGSGFMSSRLRICSGSLFRPKSLYRLRVGPDPYEGSGFLWRIQIPMKNPDPYEGFGTLWLHPSCTGFRTAMLAGLWGANNYMDLQLANSLKQQLFRWNKLFR